MAKIRRFAKANQRNLYKTGTYNLMHITVAALVAYAVTRNWWAALTLSLLEPTVQGGVLAVTAKQLQDLQRLRNEWLLSKGGAHIIKSTAQ